MGGKGRKISIPKEGRMSVAVGLYNIRTVRYIVCRNGRREKGLGIANWDLDWELEWGKENVIGSWAGDRLLESGIVGFLFYFSFDWRGIVGDVTRESRFH